MVYHLISHESHKPLAFSSQLSAFSRFLTLIVIPVNLPDGSQGLESMFKGIFQYAPTSALSHLLSEKLLFCCPEESRYLFYYHVRQGIPVVRCYLLNFNICPFFYSQNKLIASEGYGAHHDVR